MNDKGIGDAASINDIYYVESFEEGDIEPFWAFSYSAESITDSNSGRTFKIYKFIRVFVDENVDAFIDYRPDPTKRKVCHMTVGELRMLFPPYSDKSDGDLQRIINNANKAHRFKRSVIDSL